MPAKEELSPEVAFPALGVVICESCARELVTLAPFAGRDIRRRDAGVGMGMLIVSLFDIKLASVSNDEVGSASGVLNAA